MWQRHLIGPLNCLLGGGLAPATLTWALALGMLIGCMPLLWGTSLLCLGAALLLRLNPLAVQIGNFAAWPLQILLVYPYLRLGELWFGISSGDSAHANWLIATLSTGGNALGAWTLTAPLLLLICHLLSRLLVTAAGRLATAQAAERPNDGGEPAAM